MHHGLQGDKNHGANIILMEVAPVEGKSTMDKKSQQSYVIGGYASHQWKANNDNTGDKSCFLFNLTSNLRFNARANADGFYQRTKIVDTS